MDPIEQKRLAIIQALRQLAIDLIQQILTALPGPAAISIQLAQRRLTLPNARNPLSCGTRDFAILLRVVELILDALRTRTVVTKRELFYQDVQLFLKQPVVDNIVEALADTLHVRRFELNVVAAVKGLFVGALTIVGTDGTRIEGGLQGALIPPSQSIDSVEVGGAKWVLVVEKEAVFRTLCTPAFLQHPLLPPGILLTGKGYPDVATRELLKTLSVDHPFIPLLALVDADPHGLQILSTYVHGSASMQHDQDNLAVPSIEWIGIKASEWDAMGVGRDDLLLLNSQERKFAMGLLKRRDGWCAEWSHELQRMIHLGRKAEIEILASLRQDAIRATPPSLQTSSRGTLEADPPGSSLINYVVQKILLKLCLSGT